jgi:glycine oxidase
LNKRSDIIVIGAGAVGMLSARRLAQAGHKVVLLERDRAGRGTSRAGGGIMSPLVPWEAPAAVMELAARSLPMLPRLAEQLIHWTGIDPEYRATGMIYLDCPDPEAALAFARRTGQRAELLDAEGLARVAPAAARGEGPGAWLPDIGQIRNPRFLDALVADLERVGVELLDRAGEVKLQPVGNGVAVEAGRHGRLEAAEVVIAAGAWSGSLVAPLGLELPLRPVRGQILWYMLPRPVLGQMLMREGRYVIPRQDGVVLVGSTLEEAGFDNATTAEAARELQEAAAGMMPLLGTLAVQGQWAGLRPGSPEGVPMIGRVPGVEGLWLNTGHFRNGVNLAPGSAELLEALLGGDAPPLDPGPYDPARHVARAG